MGHEGVRHRAAPPAATFKREEAARGAREKKAATADLRGLERAGARIARLPAGTGLLSGEDRLAPAANSNIWRWSATARPPRALSVLGRLAELGRLDGADVAACRLGAFHAPLVRALAR